MLSPPQVSTLFFKYENVLADGSPWSEVSTDNRGIKWHLQFHNWGGSNTVDDGTISMEWGLMVNQKDNKDVNCRRGVTNKVSIIVRNIEGEVAYEYNIPQTTYRLEGYPRQNEYIDDNIMKFSKLKDLLCLGDLIVDVIIQYQPEEVLIPKSPLEKNMFQLFNNEQYSDVTFKVEGDSYPAHKLILSMNAPILANMCGEPNNGELDRVVEIKDTTSRVFKYVLQFIYGGNTPNQDTMVRHYETNYKRYYKFRWVPSCGHDLSGFSLWRGHQNVDCCLLIYVAS